MEKIIYKLIQENPLKYNSESLTKEFITYSAGEIRILIMEINNDIANFEFGIISENKKYRLADKITDIEKKVNYYKGQHKHLLERENLWNARSYNVLAKQTLNELKNRYTEFDTMEEWAKEWSDTIPFNVVYEDYYNKHKEKYGWFVKELE